jgi:hypothetical protein
MLRKLMVGVLATVLVATGASLAVAGGGDDGDDDGGQTIRLVSRTTTETNVDDGATGESAGDRFVFASDLFKGDENVGDEAGECVIARIVERVAATANCAATLSLRGGQITLQGLVAFSDQTESFTVAVTGGTGRYREADGEMTIETVSETEDHYTIRLD